MSHGTVQRGWGIGSVHTAIFQITRDYAGLPDVRTMTLSEIIFYYDGLQAELIQRTGGRGG